MRVLICDDSTEARRMLRTMLAEDRNLEIVGEASDGGEAIALGVDLMPDVVLMDVAMPVVDGVEATKLIRKKLKRACVLMLTGSNSRTDVARAREAGAAAYVTKDRIAAQLIEAIRELAA